MNYSVDDAGRVDGVTSGMTTYATPTAYTADGRVSQMEMGNGLWETRDYQTPGTTTRFKLGISAGSSERLELGYNYHATGNNGNLTGHTITRPDTSWTQSFTYDAVNRLKTAGETNGYSRTFNYDRYGNRWVAPNTGMTAADSHEPVRNIFRATDNRMTVPTVDYDGAGNQIEYSPYGLTYDAENRLISMRSLISGSGTYLYDGEGRRVRKSWTPGGGATEETYYIYDIAGNLAAEYGTGSNPAPNPPPPPATVYPFTDMLGSVRAVTNADGAVLECYDYLPFGRMLGSSDNQRSSCHPTSPDTSLDSETAQKFTGQVRDEETRLDYFGARYYSAAQGRFLSADLPFADQDVGDPQSWNLYVYTRNNPLAYTDPSGRACAFVFANRSGAFCRRATLYTGLDAKVRGHTRFFAAASAISQALANTDAWFGNALVDPGTRTSLLAVGGSLELLNRHIAESIQNGSLSGPNLDAAIVHEEQTAVQRSLDELKQSDSDAYNQMISDANGLLNPGDFAEVIGRTLNASDDAMLGILDKVRRDLGTNIDFGDQTHREALGNAVIEYIRRNDKCFVGGELVPRC